MVLDITSLDGLKAAAVEFASAFSSPRVFLLYGEMGVGKTTFVSEVCRQLGITDEVSSPTFSIVNEYQSKTGVTVFHFDFYRLEDESEAMDIGVEEYFYSGNYCLIEWPEKIPSLLPPESVKVELWFEGNKRMLSWSE